MKSDKTATKRHILLLVPDLLFQSRLRAQAIELGYETALADTESSIETALESNPSLVVIDLHADGIDWRSAVASANDGGAPVLAFGRHTEAALLNAAREAGCKKVVPRSQLVEELPQLITACARS